MSDAWGPGSPGYPQIACERCGTDDVEVDGAPVLCWPCADRCGGLDPAYPGRSCRFRKNHDGPCIDANATEG